jgi:Na+-transporting NADH:ubiquinone oxidoreductase subunit NqrB
MKWYWRLLVAIFALLGVWTLVPEPASKACLLGYYAHCTFTPISTIICWVIAGVCYQLGRRATKKARKRKLKARR